MNQPTSNRKPGSVRVGLVLQTGQELMRGVCRGVYRFLRVNRHWRVQGEGQYPLLQWDPVADWEGDGIIAIVNSEEQLETLLASGVPVVNAGSRIVNPGWRPSLATAARLVRWQRTISWRAASRTFFT